jgi:DNA-binding MarR family transcriptional regulator
MQQGAERCACLQLRSATRLVTKRYDEALAPSGLLAGQFSMLNFIAESPGCGVAALAEWLSMDVSTATRNLRPLLASGFISMRTCTADGRRREVRLTTKGRRALDKASALWTKAQLDLVTDLGAERYDQLLDLLKDLR